MAITLKLGVGGRGMCMQSYGIILRTSHVMLSVQMDGGYTIIQLPLTGIYKSNRLHDVTSFSLKMTFLVLKKTFTRIYSCIL